MITTQNTAKIDYIFDTWYHVGSAEECLLDAQNRMIALELIAAGRM